MNIPPSWPDITSREKRAVVAALGTTFLSRGAITTMFEEKLKEYIGTRYAVVTSSGTAALHLAIRALGIREGDLVLTTPFSFIASSNCILFEGARPIFVDIDEKTYNLDPEKLEKAILRVRQGKQGKRLKAILAVDIFGLPADWERLTKIAKKYHLYLIEDAGEAFGARLFFRGRWRQAGGFGDVSIISFTHNKQLTTGEGGVLLTDSHDIAQLARSLKNHGRVPGGGWLDHERLGYNYHLSDINCALGLAQLSRIDQILLKRRHVAARYSRLLRLASDLILLQEKQNTKRSWFVYVVRLPDAYSRGARDALIRLLKKRGIQCRNYFPPIHLQKHYRKLFGYKNGDFPIAERIAQRTISLPFFGNLTEREIEYVVEHFVDILKKLH